MATPRVPTDACFSPEVRSHLASEIAAAAGNEVFFFGTTDSHGVLVEVEVVARGDSHQVPVFLDRAGEHKVLIHNHPGGDLTPSPADLSIACEAGARGLGFFIIDNAAAHVYRVVEPFDRPAGVPVDLEEVESIFAADGLLAQSISRFEDRQGQRQMALDVARAFNGGEVVAFEAGTGVGKSFAYLVPAILWAIANKSRVVVSTATIALQEQLVIKDLPQLQRVLSQEFAFSLIKGRGNYICRRKAAEVDKGRELFAEDEQQAAVAAEILESMNGPGDGSLSSLPRVPAGELWSHFESTSDQSLKTRCRFYRSCFYYEARRRAMVAQIVIVNHHLFFSDLRIRRDSGSVDGDLVIPGYKRVIFDEAHRLEEVAATHLGARSTSRGLTVNVGRLFSASKKQGAPDRGRMPFVLARLRKMQQRGQAQEHLEMDLLPTLRGVKEGLSTFFRELERALEKHVGDIRGYHMWRVGDGEGDLPLNVVEFPLVRIKEELQDAKRSVKKGWTLLQEEPFEPDDEFYAALAEFRAATQGLAHQITSLEAFLSPSQGMLSWIEFEGGRRRNLTLQVAPVRVAEILADTLYANQESVVMTSATLSVGGKWSYLSDRLGWTLTDAERFRGTEFSSPFQFQEQALLLLPTDAPDPKAPNYQRHFIKKLPELIQASRGRTFVLFTSHAMLRQVADATRNQLEQMGYPVLVQGTLPRSELLDRFRQAGNAVLFGNQTFWEGVDVPGDALSSVIIARLPFRVPSHPLEQGRIEELESRGENAFVRMSVPQAVLALKQGVGRLIRTCDDRGVVVIVDPRLRSKSYGKTFLKSLPDFKRVEGPWQEIVQTMRLFFDEETHEEEVAVEVDAAAGDDGEGPVAEEVMPPTEAEGA